MARNKVGREHWRSLTQMGDGRSLGLTLPIDYVRQLKLRPRQKVKVILHGGHLIIRK